jgi:hypothetical protein
MSFIYIHFQALSLHPEDGCRKPLVSYCTTTQHHNPEDHDQRNITDYIQNNIKHSYFKVNSYVDGITGIINVNLDVTDQLLITYCAFIILQKRLSAMGHYLSYLESLRKPVTQSGEKYCTPFSLAHETSLGN